MKTRLLTYLIAACALLACAEPHLPAKAQSEASALSALSALPVASVVVGAQRRGRQRGGGAAGAVHGRRGAGGQDGGKHGARHAVCAGAGSDGASASIEIVGRGMGGASLVAGASVIGQRASAPAWCCRRPGEAIAFIPNALGRALLHNERLTLLKPRARSTMTDTLERMLGLAWRCWPPSLGLAPAAHAGALLRSAQARAAVGRARLALAEKTPGFAERQRRASRAAGARRAGPEQVRPALLAPGAGLAGARRPGRRDLARAAQAQRVRHRRQRPSTARGWASFSSMTRGASRPPGWRPRRRCRRSCWPLLQDTNRRASACTTSPTAS